MINSFRHLLAPPLQVSLALQGGGAHGAFTRGVLDRLLEEPRFDIAAVSGTSAGAVNAVALAWGWCEGGRQGARALLERVWQAIGQAGRGSSIGLGGIAALALGALADTVDLRTAMYACAAVPALAIFLGLLLPSPRAPRRLAPEPVL